MSVPCRTVSAIFNDVALEWPGDRRGPVHEEP
jgi:hypothetical protein